MDEYDVLQGDRDMLHVDVMDFKEATETLVMVLREISENLIITPREESELLECKQKLMGFCDAFGTLHSLISDRLQDEILKYLKKEIEG